MNKREEQKAERRNAIIQAGLELFVRKGYNATKITDIAEKVNMSTGLLFHYFSSKEKLYEELVRTGLNGTQTVMKHEMKSPIEFFEQAVSDIFHYMKDPYVTKMFVLMGQATVNDAAPSVVKEMVSQVNNIKLSATILEEGQKLGQIKEGDPLALSAAFWGSIQGIAEYLAFSPDTPIPDPKWIVDIIRK